MKKKKIVRNHFPLVGARGIAGLPLGTKYGPIPPDYIVQVPTGYSAFIGRNNACESACFNSSSESFSDQGSMVKTRSSSFQQIDLMSGAPPSGLLTY
jgi:hypothetical protein